MSPGCYSPLPGRLGDGRIAGGQQLASLIHAQPREEIVRRLAEGTAEHTLKVEWRKTRLTGSPIERDLRVLTRVVHQYAFKVQRPDKRRQALHAPEIVVANRQGLPAEFTRGSAPCEAQ